MVYGYHRGVPHAPFIPSAYSNYGASGEDVAIDTVKTAGTIAGGVGAGAAAATTVTGGAVTGLLTAAGVSAAAVPIIGWVVGGVIAASAGVVALVAAVKGGKVRRAEAVETARGLGIAEPEKAPGFIVRALKIPKKRRAKLLARLQKRVSRLKGRKRLGKAGQKRLDKVEWKVAVLVALDKVENPKKATSGDRKAMRMVGGQRKVPDPVTESNSPAVDPEAEEASETAAERAASMMAPSTPAPTGFQMPTWGWVVLAGGVGVVLALAGGKRSDAKGK